MIWPNTLLQFQWKISYTDSVNISLPVIIHSSPKWFYVFGECERDANEYCYSEFDSSGLQSMSVHIISRRVQAPTAKELSANLALYLVRREIRDLMKQNCYACTTDYTSQLTHMEGGCLMNWEEAVDIYMDLSLVRLTPERIEPYISRICHVVQVTKEQFTIDLHNRRNIEDLIIASDTDMEYDLLFQLP